MKLLRFNLPPSEAAKNVRIVASGSAMQAVLVAHVVGQGNFPPIAIDPNGTTDISLPAGNYLFHIGFLRVDIDCDISIEVDTRSPDSPFKDDAAADAGRPGQLTIYVVVA